MLVGLSTMGLTSIGVVMLLSDIAFSPAVTVIVTAVAAVTCGLTWYALPLARRRVLRGAGRRRSTRPLDAA
jgi:hypothetical protein